MAFQQPTRQATQRVFRPTPEDQNAQILPQQGSQPVEESQTWVLFSPPTDADSASSYLTCTHQSNITPGRSQVSDIGSVNTPARSDFSVGQHRAAGLIDVLDEEEDDAELDSLDSHLPEFRSTPNFFSSPQSTQNNVPVVPAHDGLGSFRLEQEGMGPDAQDRLYAFEQYNPRRVKRRRESFEIAQAQLEDEETQQVDKMRRIEAWRLEQSRILLEEIQKETRRRRRSNASKSSIGTTYSRTGETAAESNAQDREDQGNEWHDQNASDLDSGRESIWGRITRKVVRDILGIDEKMLTVLFGEALPDDEGLLSSTPKASSVLPQQQQPAQQQQQKTTVLDAATDPNWQLRMLERVAKELGLIIHQLSDHPGAFSTFSRVQQMPIPYAGLPSIPEATNDDAKPRSEKATNTTDAAMEMPEFKPTIGPHQTRPTIDVMQRRASHSSSAAHTGAQEPAQSSGSGAPAAGAFTQEEWEQDLDIRLVFRYLRSRFMPRLNSNSSATGAGSGANSHFSGAPSGSTNNSSAQVKDAAAKVARVRQHHPLVAAARSRPVVERGRNFKATTAAPTTPAATASSPVIFRATVSSCASQQSTRRSVRKSTTSCSSSRHYWDIGGSVGTGSLIAGTTGPMGSWGEV